ncbi:DUF6160 family protein [Marinobacter sp. MDS2]|uniref:DUF6160 family protein n=1 Tax=Marinobacter sp. MDS2 TaxID=3065961 RepID=UPI00273AFEED|nr:DUF6160 family protein [Marinobacter sp. MDS2]MDP4548505.1 DUF6160 family protein [Marinobacter sp. MDS2]
MKSLKKTALVLAVAGLPLAAQADLKPLEDAHMSNVTGQAGVTIELETKLSIDEFIYTDEGSFSIKDIKIGGANRTDLFEEITNFRDVLFGGANDLIDNIKIDIDVAADGDAIINIWPITAAPIDFGVSTGNWSLQGATDSTLLASNFSMVGAFTKVGLHIDTATDTLNLKTQVGISDLDVDVDFLALGIRDLKMTGADYMGTKLDGSAANPSVLTLGANIDMDIYKSTRLADPTQDALAIDLNTFAADMSIGDVLVGGTSIGSVMLDNLVVENTTMRIYGH